MEEKKIGGREIKVVRSDGDNFHGGEWWLRAWVLATMLLRLQTC